MKRYRNLVMALTFLLVFLPFSNEVTIDSIKVTSIRPFAGRVNNQLVGTRLTTYYWYKPGKVKGVRTYEVWCTPLSYLLSTPVVVYEL